MWTGEQVELRLQRLHADAVTPRYAHPDDAGMDLVTVEGFTLDPGQRWAAPTGWAMAIPAGWVGLVHPRSGLASRSGLTVANAPGTIDAGYRGEVKVLLVNLGDATVPIDAGDRIAQLLLQHVGHADVTEVSALDDTGRGAGGFGSTGRR